MKKRILILIVLMGTLAFAACGGGDDGDGSSSGSAATISLNIDAATPASDMSDDEAGEFCSSAYNALVKTSESMAKQLTDSICPLEGVLAGESVFWDEGSDGDIVDACDAAVTECEDLMESEDGEWEEDDSTSEEDFCDSIESALGDCDVTVGELVDCLNAVNKMVVDLVNTIADVPSCSELNNDYYFDEEEVTSDDMAEMPSECDDVFDKCPDMEYMAASADGLKK